MRVSYSRKRQLPNLYFLLISLCHNIIDEGSFPRNFSSKLRDLKSMPADRMICHGLTSYSPGRSKVTAYSSTLSSSFPSKSSSVWQSSLVMSSPLSTPLGTRGSKLISLAVKTALKERETIHDTDQIGNALCPLPPKKIHLQKQS